VESTKQTESFHSNFVIYLRNIKFLSARVCECEYGEFKVGEETHKKMKLTLACVTQIALRSLFLSFSDLLYSARVLACVKEWRKKLCLCVEF
jgi:hypothetical protein